MGSFTGVDAPRAGSAPPPRLSILQYRGLKTRREENEAKKAGIMLAGLSEAFLSVLLE